MAREDKNYVELNRGGFLVDTPVGYIQFGSPPETIKDTMGFPKGVPMIFVMTDVMFDWIKGISLAEVEFPIYYNFFLNSKKTIIICNREQYPQLKTMLQESIFGPVDIDIASDYSSMGGDREVPDIRSEMNFFRNNLQLKDLISVGLFNNNSFTYKHITIEKNDSESFNVTGPEGLIAEVPGKYEYKPTFLIGERLPEPYKPPLFSITCLGPSHGFDPDENTSGYIIWLNHHGIMVDPPVNSTEWLEASNVNPKLIDSIILTHCHADHDAGTFQKILEEGRITVYATETVMHSFLRKYSALSSVSVEYLKRLFNYYPVKIGKPLFIHGGRFDMFYTLHSIPTIGFKMNFQNQTFVYTSDHNNDPAVHKKLLDGGHITGERYNELRNFPWDSKVIYHEAGIPPLHTPVSILDQLPEDVKKRIVVYHIAKKDFPQDTMLTLAEFGIENTLVFDTEPPFFEKSYQVLNVLKHLDIFQDLSVEKVQQFVTIVHEERFNKGDLIIEKGSSGDKFYIIYSGNVSVSGENLEEKKLYGTYEYFGEVALVTGNDRAADVTAETDVVAYTIERDKFLDFIHGTDFEKTLMRLAKIRNSETWNLLSTSKFFRHCTSSQKTWLESLFEPVEREEPGIIIKEGEMPEYIYIIRNGSVEVHKNGQSISTLTQGDIVGSMQNVHKKEPAFFTFKNNSPVSLYAMKSRDIFAFAENNPGILMKLSYEFAL
jgi:CRP-like cAMP-binding protein/phosphoribosyl 1,2-cyclic phosphodiesterase